MRYNEERHKRIYENYLDALVEGNKRPMPIILAEKEGITRERMRQILEDMQNRGYLIKVGRGKFMPNFLEKGKLK